MPKVRIQRLHRCLCGHVWEDNSDNIPECPECEVNLEYYYPLPEDGDYSGMFPELEDYGKAPDYDLKTLSELLR